MTADSTTATVSTLDRIKLRLPAETFEAIDAARAVRSGNVSGNTWMAEVVEENGGADHA